MTYEAGRGPLSVQLAWSPIASNDSVVAKLNG